MIPGLEIFPNPPHAPITSGLRWSQQQPGALAIGAGADGLVSFSVSIPASPDQVLIVENVHVSIAVSATGIFITNGDLYVQSSAAGPFGLNPAWGIPLAFSIANTAAGPVNGRLGIDAFRAVVPLQPTLSYTMAPAVLLAFVGNMRNSGGAAGTFTPIFDATWRLVSGYQDQ